MNKTLFQARFWSACLGNLFEHYDAALFGFLSPFIAPLIFPKQDPLSALILTYAMIPLGMLARPLGSLVFGYIGDVYGRRKELFITLSGMAIVSVGIAFTPTYKQIGAVSPIIFGLSRVLQNFLSAGESMGGAIFLLENTPEERRDFISSVYNASTVAGILLASAGVFLLSFFHAIEEWRMLYFFGAITALFGVIIRRQVDFSTIAAKNSTNRIRIFWTHRKALLQIALCSGFAYANYSMALVLINGFVPLVSPFTKAEMMGLNTGLLILDFSILPLFGIISTKISRERLMLFAALSVAFTSVPLIMLLGRASFLGIVCIRILFVVFGVAFFAPFHAWASSLLPEGARYSIISLGYALGSQLFGGPTAAISLWLFKTTQISSSICWYWMALALVSSLVTLSFQRRSHERLSRG